MNDGRAGRRAYRDLAGLIIHEGLHIFGCRHDTTATHPYSGGFSVLVSPLSAQRPPMPDSLRRPLAVKTALEFRGDLYGDSTWVSGCSLRQILGPSYARHLSARLRRRVVPERVTNGSCEDTATPKGARRTIVLQAVDTFTSPDTVARFSRLAERATVSVLLKRPQDEVTERYDLRPERLGISEPPVWTVFAYRVTSITESDRAPRSGVPRGTKAPHQ